MQQRLAFLAGERGVGVREYESDRAEEVGFPRTVSPDEQVQSRAEGGVRLVSERLEALHLARWSQRALPSQRSSEITLRLCESDRVSYRTRFSARKRLTLMCMSPYASRSR